MMSRVLEHHVGYLFDAVRVEALARAITAAVRPGDLVVDLGSGTGILALMACEAGASRVFAIEENAIIGIARELARANLYADRIQFIRARAADVTLPEKADVAVSDLLGEFAFEGGVFDVLLDAGARLLKPNGRCIPSSVALHVAPIELGSLREHFQLIARVPGGFDVTPLLARARKTTYQILPPATALLASPVEVGRFHLPPATMPTIACEHTVTATRPGRLDAVAGWFHAELIAGVNMSNAPTASPRLERHCVGMPVNPPIDVQPGDELTIAVRLLVHDRVLSWRVRRRRAGADDEAFEASTFEGLVLSLEDLRPFQVTG